jgi:hypothetical protein
MRAMDSETIFKLRYSELRDMMDLIKEELRLFNDYAKDAPESEFLRRLKIRILFGCVEANVAHLKASALLMADNPESLFSRKDMLALQDLEERTDKTGKVEIRSARLTLKENIKLAFRAFGTATKTSFEIDFGSEGGATFLKAIPIRDRIVHPKAAPDWRVTPEDLNTADRAWVWFGEALVRVSNLAVKK